jgi:excisionase family DNA binding protein
MSDLEHMIRQIVRDELAKNAKPANDDAPSDFLSVREAAAHARVSVYSIRRWVRRGELTKHTAGSRLLVKRDELDALLACEVVPIDARLSIEERVRRRFG